MLELRTAAPVASIIVAALSFRFLSLTDFANDHYMHLAWAQQLLLGEMPGRDFIAPGAPLTYAMSALVQWLSPGPISEAWLTIIMLAIAAGAVTFVVQRITLSVPAGLFAGLLTIALQPQLYGYPKILAPALGLALLARYADDTSRRNLITLGVWTAVAFLLRHDLGVYIAAGTVAGLSALYWPDKRRATVVLTLYLLIVGVALVPFAAFTELTQGLAAYLRDSREFASAEAHQLFAAVPPFQFLAGGTRWTPADSSAALFYLAHLIALIATILLVAGRSEHSASQRTVVIAAAVVLGIYDAIILRHPIVSRVRDLAALLAIVGVWTSVELMRQPRTWPGRTAGAVAGVALLALANGSVWVLADVGSRIRETRVLDGVHKIGERGASIISSSADWPWERFWPAGDLPGVIAYLDECLSPSDRLLVTWNAPEYYFFTRRGFGAGHAVFLPPRAFTSPRDQELMIERLQGQRVPILLVNQAQRREFATSYPLVEAYLEQRYKQVGSYINYDDAEITVEVDSSVLTIGSFGNGWPCGFTGHEERPLYAGVSASDSEIATSTQGPAMSGEGTLQSR